MFDFQSWIEVFQNHLAQNGQAYNDATTYGIEIESIQNPIWRVLGIHHLLPEENKAPNEEFGKHNVFIEMLCKQNEREGFRAINWTWEGRQSNETASPVFAGQKSLNEVIDLPLNLGMVVSVWTQGGEVASGFSSDHPDEGEGNTIGHHSFFVCFQEIGDGTLPDPPPQPQPDPPDDVALMINKAWFDGLEPDESGFVVIRKGEFLG